MKLNNYSENSLIFTLEVRCDDSKRYQLIFLVYGMRRKDVARYAAPSIDIEEVVVSIMVNTFMHTKHAAILLLWFVENVQ